MREFAQLNRDFSLNHRLFDTIIAKSMAIFKKITRNRGGQLFIAEDTQPPRKATPQGTKDAMPRNARETYPQAYGECGNDRAEKDFFL